jgi:ABC-type branched-subunit amino acid transport system substrate-binding protein
MLTLVVLAGAGAATAAAETIAVAFVGEQADAYAGFLQALDEANRQGRFLGFDFRHEAFAAGALSDGGGLPEAGANAVAVFAALEAPRFAALARAHENVPVFNLTSRADSLRRLCRRHAFHASVSEQMLADAVAQWRRAGKAPADVVATVWNTDYKRYAAAQLSGRFEDTHGRPMSDEAYAGWAATKLYAQVVMAQQTAAPGPIIEALHTDVGFDGVKGVPMQFRATGQLNQMILLEKDGKVVGEAPVRPLHDSHELETLGFNGCKE